MKKLLIISTHQSFNGIASYVEGLEEGLASDYDIHVTLLDQNILRSCVGIAIKAGDKLIEKAIERAQHYDYVNLHWRAELIGQRPKDQLRRLDRLLKGIKGLVLTAHDPLPNSYRITPRSIVVAAFDHGAKGVMNMITDPNRRHAKRFVQIIKRAAAMQGLTIVATNKRERRQYERVLELKQVYDHPPCFVRSSWKPTIPAEAAQKREKLKRLIGSDVVILGVFGLIKDYKSVITAVRALRYLPTNYHLCIFGGTDPMDLRERQHIDDTLRIVIDEMNNKELFSAYATPYAKTIMSKNKVARTILLEASPDGTKFELPLPSDICPPDDLGARVHFVDTHGEKDFCVSVAASDVCLFPYIEAGKCYSGTAHHAVELGKTVITSNSRCFGEMSKYFPGKTTTFDIGNYIQLAQRIMQSQREKSVDNILPFVDTVSIRDYNFQSQIELYRSIFDRQPEKIKHITGE